MRLVSDPRIHRLLVAARWVVAVGLIASFSGQKPGMPPPAAWFVALVFLQGIDVLAGSNPKALADSLRSHRFAVALALIALIGLGMRLAGIGGDLGRSPVDIDENRLARSVLGFFERGELDHSSAESYPGLAYWLLAGTDLLVYLTALMQGTATNLSRVPFELFLLGDRVANAFCGALTIVFVGLLGRELGGRRTGLVAALVVAVCPLGVETTSMLRNEAVQVALIVASAWAALRLASSTSDGRQDSTLSLAAGFLAGAAAAVKYTSVFALLPVILAAGVTTGTAASGHLLAPRRAGKRLGLALIGFLLAVSVTNHFLWADFPNFIHQLSAEVAHSSAERRWASQKDPLWFYTKILGRMGAGWALLALAGGFAVWGLATRSVSSLVLLAFPLPYMWFMTHRPLQFPRWVYPLVPFVAVAGATALCAVVARMQSESSTWRSSDRRRSAALAWCLLAALFFGPLVQPLWRGTVLLSRRMAKPTYGLAEAWLREHAAPGDRVLLENGWLDLKATTLRVRRVPTLKSVLDGGIYPLSYDDWVVVPESEMERRSLARLRLAATFVSDNSFGGATGFDLAVYAVPRPPPPPESVDFNLGDDQAKDYLGSGWPAPESERHGRQLPGEGASVYLPRLRSASARLEIELEVGISAAGSASIDSSSAPIIVDVEVDVENERLTLAKVAKNGSRLIWSSEPIQRSPDERVFAVRITPAASLRDARVVRLTMRP